MADAQVVEALERLVTAAVGLTTVVLGEAGVASELTLPQWREFSWWSPNPMAAGWARWPAKSGSACPRRVASSAVSSDEAS